MKQADPKRYVYQDPSFIIDLNEIKMKACVSKYFIYLKLDFRYNRLNRVPSNAIFM